LSTTTFPRSPLSFISPHSLSHLKLSSPKLVTPTSLRTDDDDDEDDMSISSGSDAVGGGGVVRRYYDEEEVFGPTKPTSKSNRGVLNDKNLRIEVPFANRRVTDGESRLRRFAMANSTPGSYLRDERPHTLSSKGSVYWDSNEDIGTPSAPPIMDIGEDDNIAELEKEIEHIEDEICREAGVESHHQQLNIGCIAGDTVSHLYPEFSESARETQTEEAAQIEDISSDELNCHSVRLTTLFRNLQRKRFEMRNLDDEGFLSAQAAIDAIKGTILHQRWLAALMNISVESVPPDLHLSHFSFYVEIRTDLVNTVNEWNRQAGSPTPPGNVSENERRTGLYDYQSMINILRQETWKDNIEAGNI
ncbi:hypothetical protein IGI04_029543, partial [Brassica rapa subsp. trilocularis]